MSLIRLEGAPIADLEARAWLVLNRAAPAQGECAPVILAAGLEGAPENLEDLDRALPQILDLALYRARLFLRPLGLEPGEPCRLSGEGLRLALAGLEAAGARGVGARAAAVFSIPALPRGLSQGQACAGCARASCPSRTR